MRIVSHYLTPEQDLIQRLRMVRLRGHDQALVYERATLELREGVSTDVLTPPQNYILTPNIRLLTELDSAFEKIALDIFALKGVLWFWADGMHPDKDRPIPLLPPIVERSAEPHGMIDLVNDGMHRVYTARKLGRRINIVHVDNVPSEYPYYAYALRGGWEMVEEISELTEGYKKKEYRDPNNYKALYREFNIMFPGVQEQRKRTQAHLTP